MIGKLRMIIEIMKSKPKMKLLKVKLMDKSKRVLRLNNPNPF